MGKDWLNEKVGANLLGAKTLTGMLYLSHHHTYSNKERKRQAFLGVTNKSSRVYEGLTTVVY